MEHLLTVWKKVAPEFLNPPLLLFLDYDGTLTPIVSHPEKARLKASARNILKKLAGERWIKIVVISGRQLADVKKRVGVPRLVYVGNHGFEVKGPKIRHIHPDAASLRGLFKDLALELERALKDIHGIHVENKIFTLSVHYRNVLSRDVPPAMGIFLRTISPYIRRAQVSYTEGKKVWEVRPDIPWNKGKMVLSLLARERVHHRRPVLPVYIGDDRTDEDALKVLKHRGIGIKVTGQAQAGSHAAYWVHSPDEVFEFLKKLYLLKHSWSRRKVVTAT